MIHVLGVPHNTHMPDAGPFHFVMLLDVGDRSRNNCQRKTLIFSGTRVCHGPFTSRYTIPWHSLWYKDSTENLPEALRCHDTLSGSSESDTVVTRSNRAPHRVVSCMVRFRQNATACGAARASTTLCLGHTAKAYSSGYSSQSGRTPTQKSNQNRVERPLPMINLAPWSKAGLMACRSCQKGGAPCFPIKEIPVWEVLGAKDVSPEALRPLR